MNIEDIEVFVEVARTENISRAAERLKYGQSNVTTKIKRIETYFQTTLLDRSRYGVSLNHKGRVLFERAVPLIEHWNETIEQVKGEKAERQFFLGSMETTAAVRLPELLARFHQMYPYIDVHLKTGSTADMTQTLLRHEIDGAFVAGPIEHKNLTSIPVFKETMVLITSLHRDGLGAGYEALEEENILVFRVGCSYRKHLEKFFDSHHFVPSKIMEFGSLDAIIGCVAAGMGVSMLPRAVVEGRTDVKIHHLPSAFEEIDTHFIYRSIQPNPCCSLFLEMSRQFEQKL